jgi:hypothetical protein
VGTIHIDYFDGNREIYLNHLEQKMSEEENLKVEAPPEPVRDTPVPDTVSVQDGYTIPSDKGTEMINEGIKKE